MANRHYQGDNLTALRVQARACGLVAKGTTLGIARVKAGENVGVSTIAN